MTAPRRVLPYGPRAVLAEYESLDEVMAAAAALGVEHPVGVVDVVPAARTILVTTTGAVEDVVATLESIDATLAARDVAVEEEVVLHVRYDGDDLADVAARTGVTVDEVVSLHSSAPYTVAFCGFMPGFSYIVGLDARLHLPRRPTPRTAVPAGAVAIASEFTAVYPSASPGGWHLLGSTDATMWDESRDVPALLPPGTTVRFEPL
jgi:KipI family sensor histidine kinase inhibitor